MLVLYSAMALAIAAVIAAAATLVRAIRRKPRAASGSTRSATTRAMAMPSRCSAAAAATAPSLMPRQSVPRPYGATCRGTLARSRGACAVRNAASAISFAGRRLLSQLQPTPQDWTRLKSTPQCRPVWC